MNRKLHIKLFLLLTAIAVTFCLLPPSNVHADELVVDMDMGWLESAISLTWSGGSYISPSWQTVGNITNSVAFTGYTGGYHFCNNVTFNLSYTYSSFADTYAVFLINRVDVYNDGYTTFDNYITGRQNIYDYETDPIIQGNIYAKRVFRANGRISYCILFLPVEYLNESQTSILSSTGHKAIYIRFRHENYSIEVDNEIKLPFVGTVDFLEQDILSTLQNMDSKMDNIITLLQDMGTSSTDAEESMADAQDEHNEIDTIQSGNITSAENGFSSIIDNPDFNLDNSSILSGASFVGVISHNIFNSLGVMSWILIFPAFIGLGVYLMGRIGVLFK